MQNDRSWRCGFRPQFGLRSVLCLLLVLALGLVLWRWWDREGRARRALSELGAEVEWVEVRAPLTNKGRPKKLPLEERYFRIEIGKKWKGGSHGLRHLAHLPKVQELSIRSAPGVDESGLLYLGSLASMKKLTLEGIQPGSGEIAALRGLTA